MLNAYQPNQAVTEYQARLAAQKAADKLATQYTPDDMVAVYDLKSRVPDWNMLLNMGAGRGGLGVYSMTSLTNALIQINEQLDGRMNWYKPGEYFFTIHEQRQRIVDQLGFDVQYSPVIQQD